MIISFCQNCRREFEGDTKKILCPCGSVMFVYHKKREIVIEDNKEEDEDSMKNIMDYYFNNGGNI